MGRVFALALPVGQSQWPRRLLQRHYRRWAAAAAVVGVSYDWIGLYAPPSKPTSEARIRSVTGLRSAHGLTATRKVTRRARRIVRVYFLQALVDRRAKRNSTRQYATKAFGNPAVYHVFVPDRDIDANASRVGMEIDFTSPGRCWRCADGHGRRTHCRFENSAQPPVMFAPPQRACVWRIDRGRAA